MSLYCEVLEMVCNYPSCSVEECKFALSLARQQVKQCRFEAHKTKSRHPTRPLKEQRPICGAKTRLGTPCQALAIWEKYADGPRNGRCRLHGGLSTGPRTPEGKRKIAEAQRRRFETLRSR